MVLSDWSHWLSLEMSSGSLGEQGKGRQDRTQAVFFDIQYRRQGIWVQTDDKILRLGSVWHGQFCHFTALTKHELLKFNFVCATDFLLAVVASLRGSFQPQNVCVEGPCFLITFWIFWDTWDRGELFFCLVPCSFPRTMVWLSYGNM